MDIHKLQSEYSNPNSELHGFGYWINYGCSKHGCSCVTHVHSSWLSTPVPRFCKEHAHLDRSPYKSQDTKLNYVGDLTTHTESQTMSKYGDSGERHLRREKAVRSAEYKASMKGRGLYGMRKNARDFLERQG